MERVGVLCFMMVLALFSGDVKASNLIVRSTATLSFRAGISANISKRSPISESSSNSGTDVTVINQPYSIFSVANPNLGATITNGEVVIGSISIGSLFDNNIYVCGSTGSDKCFSAVISAYIDGTTTNGNSGLVSPHTGVVIPVKVVDSEGHTQTLGVGHDSSVQLEKYDFLSSDFVTSASNFSYLSTSGAALSADFTNAPAGNYVGSIIVEYSLVSAPDPTPVSKRIFIHGIQSGYADLGGITGADSLCQTDATNSSIAGVYKAFLAGPDRVPGGTDWILSPNTQYTRLDGTVIGTSSGDSKLNGPLVSPTHVGSLHYVYTGFNGDYSIGSTCSDWTSASGSASFGFTDRYLDNGWLDSGLTGCYNGTGIYCVEQ